MPEMTKECPPKPSPEEIRKAIGTVLTAMLHTWSLTPPKDADKVTRAQAAEHLGFPEEAPEMEMLSLFDHWGNDIMCMAPYFGIAFAPNQYSDDYQKVTREAFIFVPPPQPTPQHYWNLDAAEWTLPHPDLHEEGPVDA